MSKVINRILYGIDLTEIEDERGYWETSTGAEFGEKVLNSVNEYVDGLEQRIAEMERKIEVPCAQRDEYLRERNEARQQLAKAWAALKDIAENANMEGLAGKLTKIARNALEKDNDR